MLYIEISIICHMRDIISLICSVIEKCLVLYVKCLVNEFKMSFIRLALSIKCTSKKDPPLKMLIVHLLNVPTSIKMLILQL